MTRPEVLGLIPARGGSKGIPGKNLALVGGRPLIAWTFAEALASRRLTRIILSTDSEQIAAHGRSAGVEVPFMRPAALAADDTPMIEVLRHAVDALAEPLDAFVLLQPTSPLRRAEHIDGAVEELVRTGADVVVSVVRVPHYFTPGSLMRLDGERLVPHAEGPVATRRQDKPALFARNGPAVYAARPTVIRQHGLYDGDVRPYVMSREDSFDIDEPFDIELVEMMLRRRGIVRAL
jgi:CMP-N,N'-diacetyllegionaminic acid synthase